MNRTEDLTVYFAGEKLYGDDFTPAQIQAWFEDEKEGYANLGARDTSTYQYVYHAINTVHGYRHLPPGPIAHALGCGSAYGDEFEPIAPRLQKVTILEPSEAFARDTIGRAPVTYVQPRADGSLPFADATFDLITCLGVLHHLPNVSYVVRELYRCLAPGGYALIREPIISMGDWTRPRRGLTKHERGIPLPFFRRLLKETGYVTVKEMLCMFPLIAKAGRMTGRPVYNSVVATHADRWFSRLMRWHWRYHARSLPEKMRPTNVYYVLTKRMGSR